MRKVIFILLLALFAIQKVNAQKYTLTSKYYSITQNYNNEKNYREYSTIVIDLNRLTIEVHRKDKTFYFKILEMSENKRSFRCVDVTGGRSLDCNVTIADNSALVGQPTLWVFFRYNNLEAAYSIVVD